MSGSVCSVSPIVYKKAKQAPEDEREEVLTKELVNRLAQEGLSPNPTEKGTGCLQTASTTRCLFLGVEVK